MVDHHVKSQQCRLKAAMSTIVLVMKNVKKLKFYQMIPAVIFLSNMKVSLTINALKPRVLVSGVQRKWMQLENILANGKGVMIIARIVIVLAMKKMKKLNVSGMNK